MLKHLSVRNILIIDHLELEFAPGLNVFTGETGAGKSILLDCLGFVLGWRGRTDLVKRGSDQGEVTALFELSKDHPALVELHNAGLSDGYDVILRRVHAKNGRKNAWINDRRVSGELLRIISSHLLELHGQQDDKGLLDPKGHLQFLDQFTGNVDLLDAARVSWQKLAEAKLAFGTALEELNLLKDEEGFLDHAVEELSALKFEIGEEQALDARRRMMRVSEKLKFDIEKAAQAVGREAAEGMIGDALRWLEAISHELGGKLDGALEALSAAMSSVHDAASEIEACLQSLEFDPYELETTEERLFTIRSLARKYHVMPDGLPDLLDQLSTKLSTLNIGQVSLQEKRKTLELCEVDYKNAAKALSDARFSGAKLLDTAMAKELVPLKLDRALFRTDISTSQDGPLGHDKINFLVATNPGTPAGPINKIASGGELSRFILALKVCLKTNNEFQTVIFDEIDRGIGGATADAVGRRLSVLADGNQVIVVTHSPQVAAFASKHFQVRKMQLADETLSNVCELDEISRIAEIARMISGDKITKEAHAAAVALINAKSI